MKYTEWKLTNQEQAECRDKGLSLNEAQIAKKEAYLKAGGIILNPDALSDLYEACLTALGTLYPLRNQYSWIPSIMGAIQDALRKAESK